MNGHSTQITYKNGNTNSLMCDSLILTHNDIAVTAEITYVNSYKLETNSDDLKKDFQYLLENEDDIKFVSCNSVEKHIREVVDHLGGNYRNLKHYCLIKIDGKEFHFLCKFSLKDYRYRITKK